MEENIYVENNNHNISQDFLIDMPNCYQFNNGKEEY